MFATRASGSTSFGGQQVSYFLGEVEGSLSRSFNDQIPANGNADDIAFQSFVGQMRGFENNIRNGNTFLVSNTEFRVPVVKYFTSKTLKSAVLNNLQVIGFFDIGSAFDGLDPTSDNSLNSDTFTFNDSFNTLSTIDVEFFRQPFVYSYGAGIRSTLFGYFLKLDLGWGIDSGDRLPARAHLSIGKDF